MKRRSRRALVCENLEPRNLLAAAPIISEFVADNAGGLNDGHGASPDWIEIYNAGDAALDLAGYHLTDNSQNLVRWTFPSTTLDAGEFLVVFASGNDAPDPQGNLHTNFSLNDQGEYLALVAPDGTTILSEFTPAYPAQKSNASYGIAQDVTETPLVATGSSARYLVPTSADNVAIGNMWQGSQPFNHNAWATGSLPLGYDLGGEQTQAASGNVALGRPTTQSTNGFNLTGAPATDGNRANLTHTASNDLAPWHETTLAAASLISQVDVFHRGDGCCPERFYNIRIEIRDAANAVVYTSPVYNPWNGSSPATPPIPALNSYSVDLSAMPGGGVIGSKVRVTKQAFTGSEWLSLGEVEVTASADLPVTSNVAIGKPTSASGPLWSNFNNPQLITDGNRATFTHPLSQINTFHYDIDLVQTTAIDKINIVNRGDGCCTDRLTNYRVTIYGDDDGEFGDLLWTADIRTDGTNSGVGGVDVLTANLDPDGTFAGRFIRVEKIDAGGTPNYWPQIAEVEVLVPNGYSSLIATNVQSAMSGVNASAYVRIPFNVADPSAFDAVRLRLNADDGFVAYLNGVEIARRHAPAGTPAFNAAATGAHYAVNFADFDLSASLLRTGENILAVHALNRSAGDHDYFLAPELTALSIDEGAQGFFATPSPGGPNGSAVAGFVADTQFSGDPLLFNGRGFYDAPFDVTLSTATPGATIVYTTDGTAPTLTHGTKILPQSAATAPSGSVHITTTTSLRAAAFKTGFQPTNVDTQTYLFLNHVINQPIAPAGLPTSWNGTAADYQMDPDVVNNPAYSDEIIDGLRSIPTMSIVMDPDDFYGPTDGIYIYPERLGIEYERPVSIEVINPDGTTMFQEDAGIRVWGTGWRPHSSTLKHSFQLKFKNIYGKGKLDSQLFPDAPVSEFDDIILRAQGSRGWTDFRNGPLEIASTQYIHDNWARDTALAMGKHDGHGTYVHLYINGMYWGLYNPVERPTGNFGEEYFGGDNDDFDVLSHRTGQPVVANEGDLTAWNQVLALADAGTASAANYAAIEQLVDIDNLIDYMLINQYATNHDGPSNGGNNMRVSRKREPGGKFHFYVWDMEYTFWNAGENSNINDVNHAGTIGHLFTRLRDNAEFRQRFSDRAHLHLTGDGALTPASAAARWQARADEIFTAVVAESARWGDYRRPTQPYTRDVEWAAELNRLMTQYFPTRTATLISHLQAANLWVDVTTPIFNQQGGTVSPGFPLTMTAPATGGFIDTPVIPAYAQANYWIPTSDALGQTWTTAGFVPPGTWSTGPTGIGYDNQTVAPAVSYAAEIKTDIGLATPSTAEPIGVFLRLPFDVANPAAVQQLTLRMRYDDGFVAYLNGTEVARRLAPGTAGVPLSFTAVATSGRADSQSLVPEDIDISSFKNLLVADTTGGKENVLAIHALNAAPTSNDFLILPELVSRAPDPNPQSSPIYYTIDGSDPRLAGGTINPAAQLYTSAVTVNTSQLVIARALRNGQWSAPNSAQFSVPPLLRVEEVMYHPVDGDAEFIEIVNIGSVPADLAGVQLAGGVTFTFSGGTLAPGARAVVVRDQTAFEANYGNIAVAGEYSGSLNNAGDTITLLDAGGGTIQSFMYDDDPVLWYPTTDGGGHSLVIRDALAPVAAWDAPASWRPSNNLGGSPGQPDSSFVEGDLNGDLHVNLLDLAILQTNLGIASGATRSQGDLNGDGAVNHTDAASLAAHFGRSAGVPAPAAAPGSIIATVNERRQRAAAIPSPSLRAVSRSRRIVETTPTSLAATDHAFATNEDAGHSLVARRARIAGRR